MMPIDQYQRPIFGLALGGGAVRGLAHLGVLRAFERSGLSPAVICGTSSGAVIGGAVASGSCADALIDIALGMRWSELVRPRPRRDHLFDTTGLDEFIAKLIPAKDFADLEVPFASVAEDQATGKRVVLKRGNPRSAVAASSAIRRAFPPVQIDGLTLIDGIDVEPVPARAARELGATYVVGVDILRVATKRRGRRRPSCSDALRRRGSDLVIRPRLGTRSPWNFSHAADFIALGEQAAAPVIDDIHTALVSSDAASGSCTVTQSGA